MYYAHVEEKTNLILGYYTKDVHVNIPEPYVQLTNEKWSKALDMNATHIIGGELVCQKSILPNNEKASAERAWRDNILNQLLARIDQYEKDKNYPEELRTSPIKSEADFLLLLNDRKLLSDYPNTDNFPFGERPALSNLV